MGFDNGVVRGMVFVWVIVLNAGRGELTWRMSRECNGAALCSVCAGCVANHG